MTWHFAAKTTDIPVGKTKAVYVEQQSILIANVDSQFYAIENRCSHDHAPLEGGEIEGDQVICPRHGAAFCLKTGEVLCPPAYEDIETYPIRVQGEDLEVEL